MTPEPQTGKDSIPGNVKNEKKHRVRPESIDPGRSVLVVSDLHLGGTEDPHTSTRFCRFLEYVAGLFPETGAAQEQNPNPHKLLRPQKFIILGDFFDLWDPRSQDRNTVLLDAMIPIARIGRMDCDVIFVTGNHDEDIGELVDLERRIENKSRPDPGENGPSGQGTGPCPERTISYLPPVNEGSPDEGSQGLEFQIHPGRKWSVYKKSYIPGPEREGLNVGGVYYAFLHGHQFDPEQITHRISEYLKQRFDPVSVLMDYANTGLSKLVSIRLSILFLLLWILAVVLSKVAVLGTLFSIAFWVLTFIVVVISIPRVFAFAKREAYNRIKTRDMTVAEVIGKDDEEQRLYFRPEQFTLGANVVIFGHTHCAGKQLFTIPVNSRNPRSGKHLYLFNSGCWVRNNARKEPQPGEPTDPCKDHLDTFVYIDADGTSLMKWVEEEKTCKGSVSTISHVPRSALLREEMG